ncbi:MAG TPA: DUF1015 domain-containing protein [Fimbriimonadaceae bacterium]|nr:DUF1015 domain-containing protein [Fimbriimonadaceae bacterium]
MAEIKPFYGLRYAPEAGELTTLVAPPYDVLSWDEREAYAAKNPHNVVYLTLPEQEQDDRSKYVKYQRSNARLMEWRRNGVLQREPEKTFYRYVQTFTIPGQPERFTRTSVIALIKTEPYEKGVVLPHEQTFPKHKEDRLRVLEATRAHLECIYGLFDDDDGEAFKRISAAQSSSQSFVVTDDGVTHSLENIDDPEECRAISQIIADKKVWIADGHHRYETACTFRAMQGDHDGRIAEDYMMMALGSMSDPGLVLLPTHRIVKELPINANQLDEALLRFFHVRKVPNGHLMQEVEEIEATGNRAFGVALPGGIGLIAVLDDLDRTLDLVKGEGSTKLRSLDVSILHSVILEEILQIKGLDLISYTRDPEEAVQSVNGGAAAAFLMSPPTVQDMREIATGGEKMPQKSTYYYPKILSGLVIWSLNDFEA